MLEKKGNEIHITSKAKQLLELVPEDLKKPELTAEWEMKLLKIAKGELDDRAFMSEIRGYTKELLQEIRREEGTFRHENMTNKKCPNCGKRLLAVNGKNAKLLVCQDRACGYRETVSRTTNARCPICHKRMEMIGKGDDSMFVCSCGHKERLSKFQERRQKRGRRCIQTGCACVYEETAERGKRTGEFRICRCAEEYPAELGGKDAKRRYSVTTGDHTYYGFYDGDAGSV